jgi:cell division protein ZapE
MDSFFACMPLAHKRRVHFHRFMQEIHQRLAAHPESPDPLAKIARDIAKQTLLLCLDEFHISDIGDAMLMRRLLEGLFGSGIVLITTSNTPPNELYRHGLQRGQFLPAIALIQESLDIVHMDGGADYRLRAYENAGVYHVGESNQPLEHAFLTIARHHSDGVTEVEVAGRMIKARQHAPGIVWFDFGDLCGAARGKPDYIEIAQHYQTVIVSGIPRFTLATADQRQRFIWLVDEFYDRRVKLIASAAAMPEALNPDNDDFVRTRSRLIEMQSSAYLSLPHRS